MSEMMYTTGEKRDCTCRVCISPIKEVENRGVYGSVLWLPERHDAPCGLPCWGGAGVPAKAYRTGEFHKSAAECPRCKKGGS